MRRGYPTKRYLARWNTMPSAFADRNTYAEAMIAAQEQLKYLRALCPKAVCWVEDSQARKSP